MPRRVVPPKSRPVAPALPVAAAPAFGPAIGLLEIESIARGIVVADVLVKRAPVKISLAEATTPGKYLLLFHGGVAEVDESFRAGVDAAASALLDKLFLPQAHALLVDAIDGKYADGVAESVGIVETHTVASALLAADTALKRAEVWLTRLHLARNIGGKGYFTLSGELHMVEAALDGAASAIEAPLLLATELIQQPHAELKGPVL